MYRVRDGAAFRRRGYTGPAAMAHHNTVDANASDTDEAMSTPRAATLTRQTHRDSRTTTQSNQTNNPPKPRSRITLQRPASEDNEFYYTPPGSHWADAHEVSPRAPANRPQLPSAPRDSPPHAATRVYDRSQPVPASRHSPPPTGTRVDNRRQHPTSRDSPRTGTRVYNHRQPSPSRESSHTGTRAYDHRQLPPSRDSSRTGTRVHARPQSSLTSRNSPPPRATKRVYDRPEDSTLQAAAPIREPKRVRVGSSSHTERLLRHATRHTDKHETYSNINAWAPESHRAPTSRHPSDTRVPTAHSRTSSHALHVSSPRPQPGPSRPSRSTFDNSSRNNGSRYHHRVVSQEPSIDEDMDDEMMGYIEVEPHSYPMDGMVYSGYEWQK